MFTGNIGDAQGLEILPEVAILLSKEGYLDKIRFILIGDGRNRNKLEERIDSRYWKNVYL